MKSNNKEVSSGYGRRLPPTFGPDENYLPLESIFGGSAKFAG
jgi:hypothetical protein